MVVIRKVVVMKSIKMRKMGRKEKCKGREESSKYGKDGQTDVKGVVAPWHGFCQEFE